MEFYSVIKKNKIISFSGKWMELEIIMLSEISQSHKDKYPMFLSLMGARGKQNKTNQNHESERGTTKEVKRKEGKGGEVKSNRGGEYFYMCTLYAGIEMP
jgi:hypothetical protein